MHTCGVDCHHQLINIVMFVKRADVLQTHQTRKKLKNFKEASLRDRHSITLRGLHLYKS